MRMDYLKYFFVSFLSVSVALALIGHHYGGGKWAFIITGCMLIFMILIGHMAHAASFVIWLILYCIVMAYAKAGSGLHNGEHSTGFVLGSFVALNPVSYYVVELLKRCWKPFKKLRPPNIKTPLDKFAYTPQFAQQNIPAAQFRAMDKPADIPQQNPKAGSRLLRFIFIAALVVKLLFQIAIPEYTWRQCAHGNTPDYTIEWCSKVIAANPKNAGAYNNRANAYNNKGLFERALGDLNEADSLQPNDKAILNNRGDTYIKKHEYDKALSDLNAAIRIDQFYPLPYLNRSIVYSNEKHYDWALKDVNDYINLQPNSSNGFLMRATIYYGQDKDLLGTKDLDRALQLDPNNEGAYLLKGLLLQTEERYSESIQTFNQAIHLKPTKEGYFYRGMAKFYALSSADAIADLGSAKDFISLLYSDDTEAFRTIWLHLARMRSGQDDHAELERNAAPLAQDKWPMPIITLYLGKSMPQEVFSASKTGDLAKLADRQCDAEFYVGEYYLLQKNKEQAAALFKAAASDCPVDVTEKAFAHTELKALGL
jgi:lipoprotein NlpI